MEKKYGLLLDFDGVVVDSEPLYEKAMMIQFDKYGIDVQPEDWLFFKGKDAKSVFEYINEKYYSHMDVDKVKEDYRIDLLEEFKKNMGYVPGFLDFYYACINDEFSDLLVTSTGRDIMEWTFKNVPVDYIFSGMITAFEVQNTKPHPEPYLKAAQQIGIPIERCVVIEDSVNGIRSGKAAGAKVIGIATTFPRDIISEADLIIDSYDEINPKVLKKLIHEEV